MKLFGPLYERAIGWAKHPRAPTLLTVLSFFEAIIFPVMPENPGRSRARAVATPGAVAVP